MEPQIITTTFEIKIFDQRKIQKVDSRNNHRISRK